MKNVKELKVEDLSKVTGGINPNKGCSYYLARATAEKHDGKCYTCFYSSSPNNQYICNHPSKQKNKSHMV